jgi:hypothetical protein
MPAGGTQCNRSRNEVFAEGKRRFGTLFTHVAKPPRIIKQDAILELSFHVAAEAAQRL